MIPYGLIMEAGQVGMCCMILFVIELDYRSWGT